MIKVYLYTFTALLFSFFSMHSQEKENSNFKVIGYGGFGYGIMNSDSEPTYNVYSNNGELLFNYKFNPHFGIATGIGLNEISGNGFNSIGNFYHERTMIKVPILITMDYNINDKLLLHTNLGFYSQTIIQDEYSFLNTRLEDAYDGWNFGMQLNIGFVYQIKNDIGFGINFSSLSDLTKLDTTTNSSFDDKQKLKSLSSLGVIVIIEF